MAEGNNTTTALAIRHKGMEPQNNGMSDMIYNVLKRNFDQQPDDKIRKLTLHIQESETEMH